MEENLINKKILLAPNIIDLKKNNIIPKKIKKKIEIVVVPNFGEVNSHQDNVGIIFSGKRNS